MQLQQYLNQIHGNLCESATALYCYSIGVVILLNIMLLILDTDINYPGKIFYKQAHVERITSSETTISLMEDMGISIHIPEDSLANTSSEDEVDLMIRPCFTGPFQSPQEYESASPVYLIHPSRPVEFQKDVTIRIHHSVNLKSEKECEDMVFLSASSTPKYYYFNYYYKFREIKGAKMSFKPGDRVGEIKLRHFCDVKIGKKKRKREETSSVSNPKKNKGTVIDIL